MPKLIAFQRQLADMLRTAAARQMVALAEQAKSNVTANDGHVASNDKSQAEIVDFLELLELSIAASEVDPSA